MSIRTDKVASLIKRILTQPIAEIAEEYSAGLVTVTSVRVSKDLQLARVYISVYDKKMSPGEFVEILEKRKKRIRSYLGSNMRLRYTPDLQFHIDDTLDQMDHIQDLIDNVNTDDRDIKLNPDDYKTEDLP